jgi:hypothetical protein
MIRTRFFNTTAALLLTFQLAQLAHATEFTFKSKLDVFKVDVSDGEATFNGQAVSTEPFAFIKPIFSTDFDSPCDGKMGRPDLTITRKKGDVEEKRLVYIEKKIVSNGTDCVEVTGHGIYQLPLHRNWFEGKKSVSIGLGNAFSIYKDKKVVVDFEKTEKGWRNKDPKFFTNWLFFEKFVRSLKDFSIHFRVHPAAAKVMTSFELHQGERIFTFVKVGESTWAVQFPGSPWLAASGDFGLFEDMSPRIWLSPYEKTLAVIKDTTAKPEMRIKAIRSFVDSWGPDVKYVLHEVMLTGGDDSEVRKEIASLMRARPTTENFKVLAAALKESTDQNLQGYITKVLRVRNPKGPTINDDDAADVVAKKVKEWQAWAAAKL